MNTATAGLWFILSAAPDSGRSLTQTSASLTYYE
jgi:hypothetical protein